MSLAYMFPMLALVCAGTHIYNMKRPRQKDRIVEMLLLYFLVFCVGLTGLWGFLGHALDGARVAQFIGWPPGNPFQFEVAVANLAFSVLGFLAVWVRGSFWTATVIGYTVFLWGAAFGHIRDIIVNKNYAPGNAGAVLNMDIIIPVLLISLLILLKWLKRGHEK